MAIDLVEKLYVESDFTPLSEHNSQTPTSFFAATPILHLHCSQATIKTTEDVFAKISDLTKLSSRQENTEIPDIDVWVTSKYLALSSSATGVSIRIDYPTIAVHGQQDNAVMLVLTIQDDDLSNEDSECVQIHIIPHEPQATNGINGHVPQSAQDLFKAIGDCQELNPDPTMRDDDEDIMQPGAGGWITSENMHEYVDEDGNFLQPLGQGAGLTRTADDAVLDEDEDDSKWQRTG